MILLLKKITTTVTKALSIFHYVKSQILDSTKLEQPFLGRIICVELAVDVKPLLLTCFLYVHIQKKNANQMTFKILDIIFWF